jgi:hypothetical protein
LMRGLAISPPRFSKYCEIAIPPEFSEKKKLAGDLGLEPLPPPPLTLPLLPTTTILSALSSLHPRPMTKTRTLARRWRSKACASAHSWTVPVNPPQPLRCCHCAAAIPLCAAAALCAAATAAGAAAADAAAAAAPPPSCRQRRAVALPPLSLRCRRHAVHRRRALRCRHRRQASADVALLRCR